MKINDSAEYELSSPEMKAWAFTHSDNYVSAAEAAERMGVDLKDRTVTARANTGDDVQVPVDITMYDIAPSKKLKIAPADVDGRRQRVYLIKGSSPAVKSAVWVTIDSIKSSEEFKNLKQQINDASREFKEKQHDYLLAALQKSLPAAAKKALQDRAQLKRADSAFEWFKKNGFNVGSLTAENFKNFSEIVAKKDSVPSEFNIAQTEKYGHSEGSRCVIDFDKKVFHISGWSSSD